MSEDSFFPGQLIQEADGSFNIDVTGHIHAQGLDLDAGTVDPAGTTSLVSWKRLSDGAMVAQVYSAEVGGLGGVRIANLRAVPNGTNDAIAGVDAYDATRTISQFARLSAISGANSAADTETRIVAQTETKLGVSQQTIVLDATGASDYLLKIQRVGGRTTFAGNGTNTVAVTIPHGLVDMNGNRVVPKFYSVIIAGNGFAVERLAPDNTNLYINAFAPSGTWTNLVNVAYTWGAIA